METRIGHLRSWLTSFLVLGFVLLFISGYAIYITVAQNESEQILSNSISYKNISVKINSSKNQNDKWETSIRRMDNPDVEDLFTGETCSAFIENKNNYAIKKWILKIEINQECYLNGFWCGDFEVHQFRGGQEISELVKNSQIEIEKLKVECNRTSNNLMIHLLPGDYLIYYPSVSAKEDVVMANADIGIGFIFYYQNDFDIANYELRFHTDIKLIDTTYFKIILALIVMWLIGLIFFHSYVLNKKKLLVAMDNSIKNISILAELYLEVHMINLDSNTGYLIKGDQGNLLFNFIGFKVSEYLNKYVMEDSVDFYKNELLDFFDMSKIKSRMENTSNLSFEYESKKKGWVCLKLFKMDKGNDFFQLIFAVQDINSEKQKLLQNQKIAKQKESSKILQNSFLDSISKSSNKIFSDILISNEKIKNLSTSTEENEQTVIIKNLIEHFKLLQNCVNDLLYLESNNFKTTIEDYNIYEIIDELFEILKSNYENKNFEIKKSIDANIPEKLQGDCTRLKQILLLLLLNAFFVSDEGCVKLSLFAKQNGENEELLFSVKDSGKGFTEQEMKEIYSFLKGESVTNFDNPFLVYAKIINGILLHMDSELKIASVYNAGTEFYFSINQKIGNKN